VAEGQRQGLPDPHQSNFADGYGESAHAPLSLDITTAEKEYQITQRTQTRLTFQKGSHLARGARLALTKRFSI
jgi:hypothetical protein